LDIVGYVHISKVPSPLLPPRRHLPLATRRYVKHQLTWFRKEPLGHWLPGFGGDPAIVAATEQFVAGNVESRLAS
jgi:hypothetical protein